MLKKLFANKSLLMIVGIIVLSIYFVKSSSSIVKWYTNSPSLYFEYEVLIEQKNKMDQQINLLTTKVMQLRENTLNKDMLEVRAKTILNLSKTQEIIILD
ncbi:hypothetical protein ABSA28_00827 [Candidatus Hepatincolaceae symbiont of Richtersius coronifer]